MIFRELLAEDAETYFNLDEFAELVIIDEVELPAQFLTHTEKKSSQEKMNFGGLHGDFAEIFFKTQDYLNYREKIPKQGDYCRINGKRYDVISSADEKGITRLVLSAYRQGIPRNKQANRQE